MRFRPLIWWALASCGSVNASPDAGTADAGAFVIGGTVTGFAGDVLVLRDGDGADLEITSDGPFAFPGRAAPGTAYDVVVVSEPTCPVRRCAVAGGQGTIVDADANVTVTCDAGRYRLASLSWGADDLRVTDDVARVADGATATPRIVTGPMTGITNNEIDSVAQDPKRDLVYAALDQSLAVFGPASTVMGDVSPLRTISIEASSLEFDAERDRLYAGAGNQLVVIANASIASGTVTPAATATLVGQAGPITYDPVGDRLFMGGAYGNVVYQFDNASQLSGVVTPSRSFSWGAGEGYNGPSGLAVDGCRDRLYVGSNDASASGHTVFVFDQASTRTGPLVLATDSAARLGLTQAISLDLDTAGRLYAWPDSPTSVWMFDAPESFVGASTPVPSRTILGVVDRGYGLDVAETIDP